MERRAFVVYYYGMTGDNEEASFTRVYDDESAVIGSMLDYFGEDWKVASILSVASTGETEPYTMRLVDGELRLVQIGK